MFLMKYVKITFKIDRKIQFFVIRANFSESGSKNLKAACRKTYLSHVSSFAQSLDKKYIYKKNKLIETALSK